MDIQRIEELIQHQNIQEALQFFAETFPGQVSFSTSFGQEDQVITDLIFRNNININVFTIDTGRLFNETYELQQVTETKYGRNIRVYFPDAQQVEELVGNNGINCFYKSVELRKQCCHIRKVVPLQKALTGVKVWVTGLRSGQSNNRNSVKLLHWDSTFNVIKFNPLAFWELDGVLKYIDEYKVPYNTLHDKGFPSIGCAPCTRAIQPGEDIRAGRWWWETSQKECGLHAPELVTK